MAKTNNELVKFEFSSAVRNIVFYSIILLVLGIITLLCHVFTNVNLLIIGIIEIMVAIIVIILGFWDIHNRKHKFSEYLESFSFCSENTVKTAILNFPEPFVVTTVEGAVQWYNSLFSKMIGREGLFNEYIQDIVPQLQFNKFIEDDSPSPESIEYKGRSYSTVGGMVTSDNDEKIEDMVGFCFTDITNERNMRKSHEEKKSVECILIVDNYDEVFKDTPNANHGALIGEIERCVNEWVYQGEGISRRYERDKFIIWFENKNFEKLVANKFNVLTTIKEINLENRIPVTLSIGIGVQGETIRENDKMARLALDMALGRGGDQAVIKTPYTFNFYGANAREVEKSTKVKARVVAHALKEVINQSSNVIIMGHATGDMDSLGAAIGLFRASKNLGKDAYIALDRATTNAKILLSHFTCDEEYDRAVVSRDRALNLMDSKTLLIIVDTHRPSMVEYRGVLKAAKAVVLIDHHRRSEEFIEDAVLTYHEPYASSTSEMVTEILQYIQENKRLSPREAEALYAGIYMDTKGFTFKTGVRTFETASYLRRMGVDPVNIKRLFKNDIGAYIQKSKIITNAKIYRENIAIAFCEDSGKDMQVIVAQAADELLNITGIEASFVLAKATNKVIISGRSLENVNVQVILEKLGGGGHITIAGAQLLNATLKMAEIELKDAIDEVLFDD